VISPQSLLTKVRAAIATVGSTAIFELSAGGEYDPNPPDDASSNVSGETLTQVSVLASPPISYRKVYRESLKEGTSLVYIPASGLPFEPKLGMKFTLSGRKWYVRGVTAHELREVKLVYELEVAN
jgi:hypothetical protein